MPSNFYGCLRHETCDSEDCSKIAQFWAKPKSHGLWSENVDDVQGRNRFAQKDQNSWRYHGYMATTFKPQSNQPNESIQNSQERKKHAKFVQMWRFCSLFSSIGKLLTTFNSDLLKKIITGYESWGYSYDVKTKSIQMEAFNKEVEVMRRLHEAILLKRTELWEN